MDFNNLNVPPELQPGDFASAMAEIQDIKPESLSYAKRYLAFVDILGYEAILAEYGEASPKTIFVDILNALSWAKSHFLNVRLTLFSDTLVLESDSEHPVVFWNMLSVIDDLRTQLLEKGFLIRGAVTFGNHFSQKGIWISPALIRAYKLESEIAQMPRVLLDRAAYSLAMSTTFVRNGKLGLACGKYFYRIGVRTSEESSDAQLILAFDPNIVEPRYLKYNEHPDMKNIANHVTHCIETGNLRLGYFKKGLLLALSRAHDAKALSKVRYVIQQWNDYLKDFHHADKLNQNYSIEGGAHMEAEKKQWGVALGKQLAQGFLYGLGFMIAVVLVVVLAQSMLTKAMTPDPTSFLPDTKSITEKLVVSGVEEMKTGSQTYFVGLLTNKSDRVARGVQVQVNLFNKDKFVDQYSTYLTGSLAAGESQYFKITCGCKENQPAPHTSYKIRVTSSGY